MPVGLVPNCFTCQRWLGLAQSGYYCQAFPKAIPVDILSGGNDHTKTVSGDHGLHYSPKVSQEEVGYEAVASHPETKCEGCEHFRAPTSCQLIRGTISPEGWCELWKGVLPVARADAGDHPRDSEKAAPVRAAGVMILDDEGHVLLLRRADTGQWAFPGGHIEEGESAEEAAVRECEEETGFKPDDLKPWTQRIADGVDFTTFLARVPRKFSPKLNDEHTEHAWDLLGDHVGASFDKLNV